MEYAARVGCDVSDAEVYSPLPLYAVQETWDVREASPHSTRQIVFSVSELAVFDGLEGFVS